jgi:hypothetical protein
MAVDRHRLAPLPALYRADVALEVGRNFFPRVEPVIRMTLNRGTVRIFLMIVQGAHQPGCRTGTEFLHLGGGNARYCTASRLRLQRAVLCRLCAAPLGAEGGAVGALVVP